VIALESRNAQIFTAQEFCRVRLASTWCMKQIHPTLFLRFRQMKPDEFQFSCCQEKLAHRLRGLFYGTVGLAGFRLTLTLVVYTGHRIVRTDFKLQRFISYLHNTKIFYADEIMTVLKPIV
jgi:hypothetical protein